ncbi:HNH endonuclease [Micromonospora sp. NPDC050187]|uniref:HNH endonuclease n=1 Tax=Micromonospora sp. NPDC050187 TaxID=3364277 RepID=UPI0037B45E57
MPKRVSDHRPDQETYRMPQLVLQSRGTERVRGPQHYEHSIRRGIRLADIASELGSDLAVLARLYPDGVARLWGSTPTQQQNNAKVRALRDRRVGDDVLFYANKHFYARTRILHLFWNPQVAKQIWQTDDKGRTWEYMMALGEVEEFASPVPAVPILSELGLPVTLRSITLVSTADYARIATMLPPVRQASQATGAVAAPRRLRRRDVFAALEQFIDLSRRNDDPAERELLVLALTAIARVANGDSRLVNLSEFEARGTTLLGESGRQARRSAAGQVLGLLDRPLGDAVHVKDVWEVEVDTSAFHGHGPSSSADASAQPVSTGFTSAAAALLGKVDVRGRAVAMLSTALASEIDQGALLARLGLAGYDSASGTLDSLDSANRGTGERGPARRVTVRTERIVRSTAVADQVKRMYGHQCQICGVRLVTRTGYYSEAAHIRGLGRPHVGDDDISNVLCLCPNHHVQFDAFAIYVDEGFVVRWTSSGEQVARLHRHKNHPISQEYLKYHRRFCGKAK